MVEGNGHIDDLRVIQFGVVARHGRGINETALVFALRARILRRDINEARIHHLMLRSGIDEAVAIGGHIDKFRSACGGLRLQRGRIGRRVAVLRQHRLDHHRRCFRLQARIREDLRHLLRRKTLRGERLAQMLLHRSDRCRILRQAVLLPVALQRSRQRRLRIGVALLQAAAQHAEQAVVNLRRQFFRQACRFRRFLCGAVQNGFNRRRIGLVAQRLADTRGHGGAGIAVVERMRFRPLRANTGGEHLLRDGAVALCQPGTQRLQHLAVSLVLHALRQRGGLHRGAMQNIFDGGNICLPTKRGADLLRHRGACGRILQAVWLLPLRGDERRQRFRGRFIALNAGQLGMQRLQHFAVGFVFDARRQVGSLHGRALQNPFNRCAICCTAQGGADTLRDGCARGGVLQRMRFRPLRTNGRGQLLGRGLVALCGRESRVQCLQHCAVGFVLDALRQIGSLNGSALQNPFNRCAICCTA